jgi:hypothetical protein
MKKTQFICLSLLFLSMSGMAQSKISNVYNVGIVTGSNTKVGGIAGYLSSTVTVSNCYYKTFAESNTLSGTTSKVDSDLKSSGLVSDLNSTENPKPFSADNVVQINNGYPILTWQSNSDIATIGQENQMQQIFYLNIIANKLIVEYAENANLQVINILGKVAYSAKNISSKYSIDIQSWALGTYIVVIEKNGIKTTEKFIKIN